MKTTLPPNMMHRYLAAPDLSMDAEIRDAFKVPRNRFYSVSMNAHNFGEVIVDMTRVRVVEAVKLSKSSL